MTAHRASRRAPAARTPPAAIPSFAEVHAALHAEILRFLSRRLGEAEAQDVAQEVFLKAARALPEFRGESQVRTWVFRMARNAAIDRIRQREARREQGLGDPQGDPAGEAPGVAGMLEREWDSSERRLIREEMRSCIRARVEALPEPYRAVLQLGEGEGLSDAEIASAVGTTVGNVKIRLHRARARLREDLQCHCTLYRDERNELACEPGRAGNS